MRSSEIGLKVDMIWLVVSTMLKGNISSVNDSKWKYYYRVQDTVEWISRVNREEMPENNKFSKELPCIIAINGVRKILSHQICLFWLKFVYIFTTMIHGKVDNMVELINHSKNNHKINEKPCLEKLLLLQK